MDATPSPEHIATRISNILAKRVYNVSELQTEKAEIQGMEHLGKVSDATAAECAALAKELHLKKYDATSAGGIARL